MYVENQLLRGANEIRKSFKTIELAHSYGVISFRLNFFIEVSQQVWAVENE